MSFLLDTNVVSEWTKERPNPGVIRWLEATDEDRLFLSVATLSELRYGVDRLPAGTRKRRLNEWLAQHLPSRFEGRIVPVDAAVADAWGAVRARTEAAGRNTSAMDALIAATAQVRGFAVVTRNVADFTDIAAVVNPWVER